MSSLSTKISSNIEAHPSKCCRLYKKKNVTCQRTKSLDFGFLTSFETRNCWLTAAKKNSVSADVVDSLGYKLERNENLPDVSCLIVLVQAVWIL